MRPEFELIAERTRLKVQRLVSETAGEAGGLTDGEIAALVWAQLSGVVTAAANGLAGLVTRRVPVGFDAMTMKQALHSQLDSAFEQAMLMKATAND